MATERQIYDWLPHHLKNLPPAFLHAARRKYELQAEPEHYHSWAYIKRLFLQANAVGWSLTEAESLSILAHALICNPLRSNVENAKGSFNALISLLSKFGVAVDEKTLADTKDILLTSAENSATPKTARLLDLKLDLFYADYQNWLRYLRGLKTELHNLSEMEFNTQLLNTMSELKSRDRIFHTREMYQLFEARVRRRIDAKLKSLAKQFADSDLNICGLYAIGTTWAAIIPNPNVRVGLLPDNAQLMRPGTQAELGRLANRIKKGSKAWVILQVPEMSLDQQVEFAASKEFRELLAENLGQVPGKIVEYGRQVSYYEKATNAQEVFAQRAAWILSLTAATNPATGPSVLAREANRHSLSKIVNRPKVEVAFPSKFIQAVKARLTGAHRYYFTWGKISSYFKFAKSMNWNLTRSEELAIYGMYLEFSPSVTDEENAENSITYLDSILKVHQASVAAEVYEDAVTIIRQIAAGNPSPLTNRVWDIVRHDLAANKAARELDWRTRIRAYSTLSAPEFYEWAIAYTLKLLNEPSIFKTDEVKKQLESRAISNLTRDREFYKRQLSLYKWARQSEKR